MKSFMITVVYIDGNSEALYVLADSLGGATKLARMCQERCWTSITVEEMT